MSELQGLQTTIEELNRAGVEVVAISSDERRDALMTATREALGFPLLSDGELAVIDAYGVRHDGVELLGRGIARPAVFLIDEQGVVRWRFVTDNWRVRVRPEQVVEAVRALDGEGGAGGPSGP